MNKRMKKYKMVIALLLCMLMLPACQQTPDKEPVVYRGIGLLEGAEEVPPYRYEAPSEITATRRKQNLQIVWNARVEAPALENYVVALVQRESFSKSRLQELTSCFCSNSKLYTSYTPTKAEIASALERCMNGVSSNTEITNYYKEKLQSDYQSAPDDNTDAVFLWSQFAETEHYKVYAETEKEHQILAFQPSGNSFYYCRYAGSDIISQSVLTFDDPEWEDYLSEFPVTKEAAEKTVLATLHDANITDMVPDSWNKACVYQYGILVSRGWQCTLTRENNGLPSHFQWVTTTWKDGDRATIGAPWTPEVLLMYVDEQGISGFDWRGAGNEMAILLKNVALLPFDDIVEMIEQQLIYRHLPTAETMDYFRVKISQLRLCSALVSIPDVQDAGYSLPVWEAVYTVEYPNSESMETYVLTLCATNGAYIEPQITTADLSYQTQN